MADLASPSRRSVVRGAAWSMPVIAVAANAPAFAASPCQNKTQLLPVTWASTATLTSRSGTAANGTTVNVTAAYTRSGLTPGSLGTGNLGVQQSGASFSIVNNTPALLAGDASANFQTVTLTFSVPVFGLTFSIDDIDRGTGYWDWVSLNTTPAELPTPTYSAGTTITGAGTDSNGWRTTVTSGGDNLATQTVTATYANGLIGVSQLRLKFWSPVNTATSTSHVLRLRQMSFRTCA